MILAAGVGSGHNMAAEAVESEVAAVAGDVEVRRLDILATTSEAFNRLYDDAYFQLVSQVPWLVGWSYDNADPPFKRAQPLQWLEQLNTIAFVRELRDYDPDVVVCTHFLPARLVSVLMARRQLATSLSIVATDYDFQGLWLTTPFHRFFVARPETRQYMIDIGVPDDRVTDSGIPVGGDLSTAVEAAALRARLGLHPDLPVVLVSAGASGGGYAAQVVQQTLRMSQPCQVVVVCGRNAGLKGEVDALVAGRDNYLVLGFTDELALLMRVASLFVGKPGGLSSSECMAAGLPMVIINPIPGQEFRNADYLLEEGAAVRCNYATTVGYKLDQLLADPARLARMAANAARIGRPYAARQVAQDALAETGAPLWISREAQRSMLQAGELGVAAADLEPALRLATLLDAETARSLAVVTLPELDGLGAVPGADTVLLRRSQLNTLRWQPEKFDLVTTGRWLLGESEERLVGVAPAGP